MQALGAWTSGGGERGGFLSSREQCTLLNTDVIVLPTRVRQGGEEGGRQRAALIGSNAWPISLHICFAGSFCHQKKNGKAFRRCHQWNLCPAEAGKATPCTQLCSSPRFPPWPMPRGTAGGSKWPSPTPALIPGTSGSREGKKAHILYAQRLPLSPGSFVGCQLGISC